MQTMKKTSIPAILILMTSLMSTWLPLAAQAPVFDTSGNGRLNGTYYFRHVLYGVSFTADSANIIGDINEAISLYGNITFDGNGNYSITNGFVADATNQVASDPLSCYIAQTTCSSNQGTAVSGTYSVSASGYGFISNPIVSADVIYGLVAANGMFSGSTTESSSAYNDLFIASPIASPARTNFSGSYNVVGFLPGGDFAFPMNPNGSGNIGTVNISGYLEGSNTAQTQSSNVSYRFSSGAGVLVFPTSTTANFISGQEFIYFSPDGQFFFGGSDTGFDMIMGVTNTSSDAAFGACNGQTSCLFTQAGLDEDFSDLGSGFADLDGYYGSLNATNTGSIIANERISDQVAFASTYAYNYVDGFTYPATGAYTDTGVGFNYWVGDGGKVRIGEGISPFLGITLALQAPAFTPTTPVYINPTGIVNAASFTPFTAGVADGEFISIFGTNLAASTVVASTVPYPTKLNNVQVLINGVPAPLYFVSAGQISAIVPSGDPYSLAQIQVNNNGILSNVVTTVFGAPGSTSADVTSPGVYTYQSQGVYAAAVDTNTSTIVTPSNPANPGDTVEVFLSGLGTVYPTVPDGATAPLSPLSYTVNTVIADVDGAAATVVFAGLAPTLAGLYQVNVTIPTSTTAGDHFLDISVNSPATSTNTTGNLEAYTQQVLISVGGGAAARPAEVTKRSRATTHAKPVRQALCTWKTSCRVPESSIER